MRIPSTEVLSKDDLERMQDKLTLILRIWKKQLTLYGHAVCKDGVAISILTKHIEDPSEGERQRIIYKANLSKWITKQGIGDIKNEKTLLRVERRIMWSATIAKKLNRNGT